MEQTYLDTPDDPTEYRETFYALYVRKSRLQEVFGVFKRTLMSRAIPWMLCITPRGICIIFLHVQIVIRG